MCRARKTPTKKPEFMNLGAWQTLCRKWAMPEFIAKSDRGKVPRVANKRLHNGGSIPNIEHKRILEVELGREASAAEVFVRTHKRKDDTLVDDEAQQTWENYNEKYGENDSFDAESGTMSNTYPRWIEHVGLKNKKFYGGGSGVDEYTLKQGNIDEPSSSTSHNQGKGKYNGKDEDIREMLELQHTEQVLLRAEYDRLRATQEAQTQKIDQFMQFQASFADNLRSIISQEVGNVVAQEVGKTVAQEVAKANLQFLDALQRRQ